MLNVQCVACSAPYDLDENRIPKNGLRMRCPKCGASFMVKPDGSTEAAAAPKIPQIPLPGRTSGPGGPPKLPAPEPTRLVPNSGSYADEADLPGLPMDADLPGMRADLPGMRADLPGRKNDDLPAPKTGNKGLPGLAGGAASTQRGYDADLPAVFADLPARPEATRLVNNDLPGLPIARRTGIREFDAMDADLPAPLELDMPTRSKGRGVEMGLPAPVGWQGPPAPAARAPMAVEAIPLDLDLPQATGALPVYVDPGGLDLPSPRATGIELDLDLPQPSAGLPGFTSDLTPVQNLDLGFDEPTNQFDPNQIGSGRNEPDLLTGEFNPHGAADDFGFDLPEPEAPMVPPQSADGEMEFSELPEQTDDSPIIRPQSAEGPAVAPLPAMPKKSPLPLLFGASIMGLLAVGAGLAATPLGPFGLHFFEQYTPGAGDAAEVARVIESADTLALHDTLKERRAALVQLGRARFTAGLNRKLLGRSLLHESLYQLRFGTDPASASRCAAIRQRLEERGGEEPEVALGLAAEALRVGNPATAAPLLERAAAAHDGDPMFHILRGEAELLSDHPQEARASFLRAQNANGNAAAAWGIARSLMGANDPAELEKAVRATLAANPLHSAARLVIAQNAWAAGQETEALNTALEVVGQRQANGQFLMTEGPVRAESWLLIAAIHERRGRTNQARQAFEAATAADNTRPEALLGAGRNLIQDRPDDALARFESVIGMSEASSIQLANGRTAEAEAQLGAARAMLELDRAQEARLKLVAIFAQLPEDSEVVLWLGRAEQRLGQTADAEQKYREAIRLSSENFDAYVSLAQLYLTTDRTAEAAQVIEQARATLQTDTASTREALGRFELQRGQYQAAATEFQRALAIENRLPTALFGLGVSQRRSGQLDAAAATFETLQTVDPGHPGLALERGMLFEAQGRRSEAVTFYASAVRDAPENIELKLRLGAAQVQAAERMSGEERNALLHEAETTLTEVQRALPASAEAEYYFGRIEHAREHATEALSRYERAINLDSRRADFFGWAARAGLEAGNLGKAYQYVARALELDVAYAFAYETRGTANLRAGRVRDAQNDFTRAMTIDPALATPHAGLAECFEQSRRLPDALVEMQRAIAINATQGDWWYILGKIQADLQHMADAVTSWTRAVEIGDAASVRPGWLADAHRLLGDALIHADRTNAIVHLRRFLELAPPASIDRPEAEDHLRALGVDLDN